MCTSSRNRYAFTDNCKTGCKGVNLYYLLRHTQQGQGQGSIVADKLWISTLQRRTSLARKSESNTYRLGIWRYIDIPKTGSCYDAVSRERGAPFLRQDTIRSNGLDHNQAREHRMKERASTLNQNCAWRRNRGAGEFLSLSNLNLALVRCWPGDLYGYQGEHSLLKFHWISNLVRVIRDPSQVSVMTVIDQSHDLVHTSREALPTIALRVNARLADIAHNVERNVLSN